MATLDERFEQGQEMRAKMADGDPSHFTLPGTDQLAPEPFSVQWKKSVSKDRPIRRRPSC